MGTFLLITLLRNFRCSTDPKSQPGVKIVPNMIGGGQNWSLVPHTSHLVQPTRLGPKNLIWLLVHNCIFHTEWPCYIHLSWRYFEGASVVFVAISGQADWQRLPGSSKLSPPSLLSLWINFNLTAKWAAKPNSYFSGHLAEISPQILAQSAHFRMGTITVEC